MFFLILLFNIMFVLFIYIVLCRSRSCFHWCLAFFYECSIIHLFVVLVGFPGGSEVKASASNAGDLGSIPRSGRSPREGNGNPLQYSCLENPMDRGAW